MDILRIVFTRHGRRGVFADDATPAGSVTGSVTGCPRRPDGRRTRTAGRREAGFTLVEVLVALTVTVVGLVGLMKMYTTTAQGNRDGSFMSDATTIAQRSVEEFRSMPIDGGPESILGTYGPLPIVDAQVDTVDGRAGITYRRWLSVRELTSVSEDLVIIRVVVEWADGGNDPLTVPEIHKHRVALELIRSRLEAL